MDQEEIEYRMKYPRYSIEYYLLTKADGDVYCLLLNCRRLRTMFESISIEGPNAPEKHKLETIPEAIAVWEAELKEKYADHWLMRNV